MVARRVLIGIVVLMVVGICVLIVQQEPLSENFEQQSGFQEVGRSGDAGKPETTPKQLPSPVQARLKQLLPGWEEKKLDWLADHYGWTAVNIVKEHGSWGAEALTALGDEGVAVMREYPDNFQQLAKRLGGKTAARMLVLLHKHLKPLVASGRLPEFLDRLEALPEKAKQLGHKHPMLFPFLVLATEEVEQTGRLYPELLLRSLSLLDLSAGPEKVSQLARMTLKWGERAKAWIELRGLDGLLLAEQFPQWLDPTPPMELPIFLEALSQNQADLRRLQEADKLDEAWKAFCLVAEKAGQCPKYTETPIPTKDSWLQILTADNHAVRFIVEYDPACELLEQWMPVWLEGQTAKGCLPSLIIDGYHADRFPQKAQHALEAVRRASLRSKTALAHTVQMLSMMARYGEAAIEPPSEDFVKTYHPLSSRFHELLLRLDHRVVFYCIDRQHDLKAALDRLEERGLDELMAYENPPSLAVQCIPGYDAYQLLWVLSKGYTPTKSEVLFGTLDIVFTAGDIMGGLKTAFKAGSRQGAKQIVEEVAQQEAKRLAKEFGQQLGQKANQWATHGLWSLLVSSPQFLRRTTAYANLMGWLAYCAERSAKYYKIPIKLSTPLAKVMLREWAINFGTAQTLEGLAHSAAQSPETALLAEKTLQCLQWLENPVQ
ncbi:MAG: hypothetical protein NZ602_14395 [Thermoguttaceae bacterium]|nr:hypothetical protein [Thermoguttaceae bacterium]MDW8036711.1 hypothetical protein [Thermoguttaceae bacterium]